MMLHMRILNGLYARLFRLAFKSHFKRFGRATSIVFPAGIEGSENIDIGNDVYVAYKSYLAAKPHTGMSECLLKIGDGCRIGRFNHFYATHRVVLGANVLTANGVYISDNLHDYRNPSMPIMHQPVMQKGVVEIGEGSWLGHNACVIGARIGRHCVVGANAVVTRDVPDFSVVVGAPAIFIKKFDVNSGVWKPTHSDGSFI